MATHISFSVSDGDASKRPTTIGYELAPRENEAEYRAKVGRIIAPNMEDYRAGQSYMLKTLPDGYFLWQKHRKETPSAKAHIDRYLYGHPNGYIFRSVNEFAPHALWLAQDQEDKCPCIGCTGKKTKNSVMKATAADGTSTARAPKTASDPMERTMREKVDPRAPNKDSVFTKLMTRLRKEAEMEVMVNETGNLSFRIEHKNFVQTIPVIAEQGAFIPRAGEIVLFRTPAKPDDIIPDHTQWKAGLVTETPHKDTLPIHLSELSVADAQPAKKGLALNYTGFRVETMTDPNSHRKDEQLQWNYLPLSCIRPFSLVPSLLQGINESEWHKSIHNALKAMATFSLALPLKFIGRWPDAWIVHGGVYLGAELLVVGDAVVISPPPVSSVQNADNPTQPVQILDMAAIVLSFHDLRPDPPQHSRVTGDYCSYIDIRLHGKLYAISPPNTASLSSTTQSDTKIATDPDLPPAMRDTGTHTFTPLPSPEGSNTHTFPLTHVIGRLHESSALKHYHSSHSSVVNLPPHPSSPSTITFTHDARAHARKTDTRIQDLNKLSSSLAHAAAESQSDSSSDDNNIKTESTGERKTTSGPGGTEAGNGEVNWFWGNDRVEALGLHTFGEMDVGEQWEEFMGRERMRYEG